MHAKDFGEDLEAAFRKIAGSHVRITIELLKESRSVAWPFGVPVSAKRLLDLHAAGETNVRFDFSEST